VALDFCVDVLALSTTGQQLHQVDVVQQRAGLIQSLSFRLHHVDKTVEGLGITVKNQDFFAHIHQLRKQIAKLIYNTFKPVNPVTNGSQNSGRIKGVTVL